MAARKKVNRNPFNEKLIHRYLLEVFYGIHGSDRASINKLLPSRLHHSRINLVVPEEHLPKRGYRPDLTLFFQGQKQGVPVEIKRVANKVPDNQLRYLASKKGILLSLNSPISSYPGVCCSQIEWERLCDWFSRSSLRLLRDAFNPDKAKGGTGWVVVLRGHSAKRNFERMLKASGRRECFWAFKNNPTSIKSVLELSKGDQLLFLFASTKGAGQGEKYEGNKMMLNAGNMNIEILDWYIGEVKDPYYMVPSGPRSTFFEAGKPPINDRRSVSLSSQKCVRRFLRSSGVAS